MNRNDVIELVFYKGQLVDLMRPDLVGHQGIIIDLWIDRFKNKVAKIKLISNGYEPVVFLSDIRPALRH